MKKLVLFLFLSLTILANGKDCFTVVSVKIDGLPMAFGKFSVYCGGVYLGNCEQSWVKRENSFAKKDLFIGITSENNKIVIHRADKSWDEFYINLDGIAMDGKHHKIKGSRLFTPRRAYEYEIEIVAEPMKSFTIKNLNIPAECIKKFSEKFSEIVDPVFFVDVCSGNKVIMRTEEQTFTGDKSDFSLDNKIYCLTETFPIVIRAYIGEKAVVQRVRTTAISGGAGATLGAIIGGVGAGVCSGGLGAPAGAAIGGAIGAFIGGGASFIVPIKGAKEIVSFRFDNFDELKPQVKPIVTDIVSDGQEIKLVISKEDIK